MALLSLFVLTAVSPTSARATIFARVPFAQSVEKAPIVAHAVVLDRSESAQRNDEGGELPATAYRLQIQETLKGRVDAGQITVGQLGGAQMAVGGSVQFTPGEEAIVLLDERGADGSYTVRGMRMGKLLLVNGVLRGPALEMDRELGKEGGGSGKPRWTLEDLRQLLRSQEELRANPPKLAAAAPVAPQATVSKNEAPAIASAAPAPGESPGFGGGRWALLLMVALAALGFGWVLAKDFRD